MKVLDMLKEQEKRETDVIKKYGGEEISSYTLINNNGYTFSLGYLVIDARYWRNFYGAECNSWTVDIVKYGDAEVSTETLEILKNIERELNEVIRNG